MLYVQKFLQVPFQCDTDIDSFFCRYLPHMWGKGDRGRAGLPGHGQPVPHELLHLLFMWASTAWKGILQCPWTCLLWGGLPGKNSGTFAGPAFYYDSVWQRVTSTWHSKVRACYIRTVGYSPDFTSSDFHWKMHSEDGTLFCEWAKIQHAWRPPALQQRVLPD